MDVERNELRRRLARRQQQKAELEHRVRAAQRQYQDEIAPLTEKVLHLQVERLRRAAQRHMRSAQHRNAYHDAQRAYETFQENRSHSSASSPDDLKALYRRASKRCHPDVVPDAFWEQAGATFQALEEAYEAGHDRAVQAIAHALDRWGFPTKEGASDVARRTNDPEHLRRAISDLEDSIQDLRGTDVYQELADAGNLDALLHARKKELLRTLQKLKR